MNLSQKVLNSFPKSAKLQFMTQVLHFPESIPKEKKINNVSFSKSFKLMMTQGYIKPVSAGVFSLMPLAMRSLEKLCSIVDEVMLTVHAQKVLFPTLIQGSLLKTTGRWENNSNLFKLKDRHSVDYCLGPTHEEVATHLLSKFKISYKALPLKLYQISNKYRDEMNPKLGFLRGREFIMKDMYTFDCSIEEAAITYETLCNAYHRLFRLLGVKVIKVKASSGDIGGDCSHEFHIISDVGEDTIFYCPQCNNGVNSEILGSEDTKCNECSTEYKKANSIEVGHSFLLGTTYSKPFKAEYDGANNKIGLLQMGCYGLGITRIIAASMEQLSTSDNIRLPMLIAPYLLSIVIPKKGSKEEPALPLAEHLSLNLSKIDWLHSNIVIDDRTNATIGKRVQEASAMGIPYVVVVGAPALNDLPKFEVIDVYNSSTLYLTHKETLDFFKNKTLPTVYECNASFE